jgi:hypothetical protein
MEKKTEKVNLNGQTDKYTKDNGEMEKRMEAEFGKD